MKKILICFGLLLAIFAVSCDTVNTVERETPQSSPKMVNDKRVITDNSLNKYAYVAEVNEGNVGGLLKIQAKLVNSTTGFRSVNYKFVWIDENGMEIPSSPWKTVTLEGGESKYVSAVAASPKAKDFLLKIMPDVRD